MTTERKAHPSDASVGVFRFKKLRKNQKNLQILNSGNITLPFLGLLQFRFENGNWLVFFRFTKLCSVSNTLLDLLAYKCNPKTRTIYAKTRSHWCLGSLTRLLLLFIYFYNSFIIIYNQFFCLPYCLCSFIYSMN